MAVLAGRGTEWRLGRTCATCQGFGAVAPFIDLMVGIVERADRPADVPPAPHTSTPLQSLHS